MLTIRGLVKIYPGPVAALQGVNLDVPLGMFGLLGPNGAGKSTLMKILAGLLEPTSGSFLLDGEDLTHNPERIWPKLGYLPQDFGFYPHLTGESMLTYLLKLKGVQAPGGLKNLVAELLERVNLSFAANGRSRITRAACVSGSGLRRRSREIPFADRRRTDRRPRSRGTSPLLSLAFGTRNRPHRDPLDAYRRGCRGSLSQVRRDSVGETRRGHNSIGSARGHRRGYL